MEAARALVERAARAHLRRQHRLRPLRLRVDPGRPGRGAAAAPAPQPRVRRRRAVPGRGRARGDAAPRERAREGLLGRARRDGRAPDRVPQPRRAAARARRAARSARAAISRRSRTSRCRSSARVEAWFEGTLYGGRRGARRGRARADPARGEGGPLADQRHAVHGRDGRARARPRASGSRAPPTSPARSRSRRSRARGRASIRRSTRRGRCADRCDSAANVLRLLEGSAIIESHRWCDKVQDAYSLRCAPQVHGASRDLLDHVEATVAVELNAATDNPLVLVDEGLVVSNGNFHGQPLAFGLDVARDGGRRAGEHLRAAGRAARQPVALGGLAAVPHRRGRPQLGLHDPAVRGRVARVREQVALPPGERRLDPDERRPGGSRLDGERRRSEGAAGAGERRAGARDRAARRRAGDRVPRAARAGPGRARDARRRARAVGAAARRPLARRRHRARCRRDPRRLDPRGRGARIGALGERRASPVPAPKRPYRDSVLLNSSRRRSSHSWATGGDAARCRVAILYFVVATAWAWRFSSGLRRRP